MKIIVISILLMSKFTSAKQFDWILEPSLVNEKKCGKLNWCIGKVRVNNVEEVIICPTKQVGKCPSREKCYQLNPDYQDVESEMISGVEFSVRSEIGNYGEPRGGKVYIDGELKYTVSLKPKLMIFDSKGNELKKLNAKLSHSKTRGDIVRILKEEDKSIRKIDLVDVQSFSGVFGERKIPCFKFRCVGSQSNCLKGSCPPCPTLWFSFCGEPPRPRDPKDPRTGEPY